MPENGSLINYTHVLFEWEQEENAISYEIQVDSSPSFNNPISIQDESLIYIDTENINWNSSYYWRVRANYSDGSSGNWVDTYNFTTGSRRSEAYSINYDNSQYSDGVTVFSSFFNYFSAMIDQDGNEIWNTENTDLIYYNTDYFGQLFGCYVDNDLEHYLPGVEFDINNEIIWEEPNNDFLHHELIQLNDGNYLGLVETTVIGPVPIGPWTNYFYSLGLPADGVTPFFPWVGDKIVIWDKDTKETIWEWNSFDHFSMNDYDSIGPTWFDAPGLGRFDWTHANALHPTYDDNGNLEYIYISSRHLSRITKIDVDSGDVVWNMGLEMQSGDVDCGQDIEFTFQHSITVTEEGNIVTLDNGNLSVLLSDINNPLSRGLEIEVLENENGCETNVVWEYSLPEEYFGFASGNVQKLENGNYLIVTVGSGGTALEVNPQNEHIWEGELNLQLPSGAVYRANRVPGLYPVAFSSIIHDAYYSNESLFIDNQNGNIEFTLYNEGSSDEEYSIYINPNNQNGYTINTELFINQNQEFSISNIENTEQISIVITPKHRQDLTKIINLYICNDGICPDVTECNEGYDECGICNGSGAIFECGCYEIIEGECDCNGNIEDCSGECGGELVEDCSGICGGDAIVDECGVCDGDGLSCGCPDGFIYYPQEDIPNSAIVFDGSLCFNAIDLNVLNSIISTNSLDVLDPIQLGTQNWVNNRITRLEVGNYFQGGNVILTSLPDNMGDMENLAILYANYNELSYLPDSITELSNLVYLVLSFNQITSLPDNFANLTNLFWIDLGYNELEYLPDNIGNLENLVYLWIFNNNLTSLPESICDLNINWDDDDYSFLPYFGAGANQLCSNLPDCIESSSNLNSSIDPLYYSFEITLEQECEEACTLMDINADGLINVVDIVTLVNIIFDTIDPSEQQLCASDANQDGTINVVDIVTIVNFIFSF